LRKAKRYNWSFIMEWCKKESGLRIIQVNCTGLTGGGDKIILLLSQQRSWCQATLLSVPIFWESSLVLHTYRYLLIYVINKKRFF
jgi:hypothetical protein